MFCKLKEYIYFILFIFVVWELMEMCNFFFLEVGIKKF